MIEKALDQFLRTDAGVAALVTSEVTGSEIRRIYPTVVPQRIAVERQMPAAVYTVNSESRLKTYCGTDSTREVSVSIDSYGISMIQARTLSEAIRAALLDFRGLMALNIRVKDVSLISSLVLHDFEPGLFRVADSFSIWYREE